MCSPINIEGTCHLPGNTKNIIIQRMILPAIAIVAVTASGCAYCPRYEFDSPSRKGTPYHNMRVAVVPIAQHWDSDWDYQLIVDKDYCAEMVAKHLAHENVFAYQEAVRDKGMKRSPLLKELQKKDYDAILAISVMMRVRAAETPGLTRFNANFPIGFPGLHLVDASLPRSWDFSCKVKFELINTFNNKVIWKEEEIGSAEETTTEPFKLFTLAFKNTFTGLIHKIETADLNDI
jgi:hypothetical protein